MIELETRNANSSGLASTSFIEAPITSIPPDSTVDCIISNRVINIVPEDKPAVFHEMPVYNPGGRIAHSGKKRIS